MIDMVLGLIDFVGEVLDFLGLEPIVVLALIIGSLVSFTGTQWIKTVFGYGGVWAAVTAFVLGFAPTISIIPGLWPEPFWIAFLVGIGTPTAYKILVITMSDRWEWVRELSADYKPQQGEK